MTPTVTLLKKSKEVELRTSLTPQTVCLNSETLLKEPYTSKKWLRKTTSPPKKEKTKIPSMFPGNLAQGENQENTSISNKYQVLRDSSDTDTDDDIGKIVRERKNLNKNPDTINAKNPTEITTKAGNTSNRTERTTNNINKYNMPSIVIDLKTANQNVLIQDLKAILKREFGVKHTTYTIIIFTENKDNHAQVLVK